MYFLKNSVYCLIGTVPLAYNMIHTTEMNMDKKENLVAALEKNKEVRLTASLEAEVEAELEQDDPSDGNEKVVAAIKKAKANENT